MCGFACFWGLLVANFHFIYSSLTVIVMVCDISHILDSPLEGKCLSKPLTYRKEFTFGPSRSEVMGQKSPDLGKGVNLWGTGVVSVLTWFFHRLCDWGRPLNFSEPVFHPLREANATYTTYLPPSQGVCFNWGFCEWKSRILYNLKERRWWERIMMKYFVICNSFYYGLHQRLIVWSRAA